MRCAIGVSADHQKPRDASQRTRVVRSRPPFPPFRVQRAMISVLFVGRSAGLRVPHSGPPMAAPAKTPRGANVATPGIEDGGGDEKPRGCLLMDFSKVRRIFLPTYILVLSVDTSVCVRDDAQNRFSDKTAFALARALENDTWLIGLNLSGNFINETGAQHLLRSLHDNSSLVELKLDGNPGITPVTLAVRFKQSGALLFA